MLRKGPCGRRGELRDSQLFILLEIAFATEPVFHRDFEIVGRDTVAGFESAIACGERVAIFEGKNQRFRPG